jgi:two-component system response regulator
MIGHDAVDILVVEDDESERASIVLALEDAIPRVVVIALGNAEDALSFLFSRSVWTDRAEEDPPKLVLLDLKMPEEDGLFILVQIRASGPQNTLALAPVVIFADSNTPSDITESYRCGANSYITKPVDFLEFLAIVKTVGQYWIKHNIVPG